MDIRNNIAAMPNGMSIDGPSVTDYRSLRPSHIPHILGSIAVAVSLIVAIYCAKVQHTLPDFAAWSAIGSLCLSLFVSVALTPRIFCVGFLFELLFLLLAWRVAAMNGALPLMVASSIAAIILFSELVDCIVTDWKAMAGRPGAWFENLLWQATVVRMFFGFNEIGHAVEKIFAGKRSFETLVSLFHHFGIGNNATKFVVVGGLIEFASAIGVGTGLFTRLAGAGSALYVLIATMGYGGEWTRGYGWATAGGGGWEYVMLILTLFLSLTIAGGGKFSVDGWLINRGLIQRSLLWLCTTRAGYPPATARK